MQFTTPLAIDALLVSFREAIPSTNVIDAQEVGEVALPEAVIVGVSDPMVPSCANGSFATRTGKLAPKNEDFDIHCAISSENAEMSGARSRAFALFDAVEDVLNEDKTLGGLVRIAALDEWSLKQFHMDAVFRAVILFTVHCGAQSKQA